MKKTRIVTSILVTALLMLGLMAPVMAAPPVGVDPPEVNAELVPGESMTVAKSVLTPVIPPKPDVYFMSDTTGSMGGPIAAVRRG